MASVAGSTRSSIVRARRGAPDGRGGRSPGLEQLISRCSLIRLAAPVDANGISQVSWRSVPCLCPAPRPRPSRQDLAFGGLVDAAPNRRPQRVQNIEADTGLQHPLSTLHERRRRRPCKTRFRLAGCASTGRGSNPLDRFERVSGYIALLLSRISPDARVVFAKRPFAGPKAVLAYLARYTHRVPISNSRLVQLGDKGVTFRWKILWGGG